jgi:hypothetical protein
MYPENVMVEEYLSGTHQDELPLKSIRYWPNDIQTDSPIDNGETDR